MVHLQQLGILTFNNLLYQTSAHKNKPKFRTVPIVLVAGLIKDFS